MFRKTIILLLVCYYVKAQDFDCDYFQEVVRPKTYYMQNPEYPDKYTPGRLCRWIGECNNNSVCRVDCQIEMPESPNCEADQLLVSRSGDETLTGADRYCGTKNLTFVSYDNTIVLGLIVPEDSKGGRVSCRLKSKSANHPKYCRCGEIKQPRIVGGNATGEHQYPMMAGIRDINTFEVFCGAAVIKYNWVISAAHCLMEEKKPKFPKDLRVIAGNADSQKCITYQVRQYFTHPNYVHNTNYDYDVALIQSITSMLINYNVLPVCLPYEIATDSLVGDYVTELGWGTLGVGRPSTNMLQEVQLRVVSSNYCQQSYPDIDITSRRICTFAEGKDSCQMDSGGPLLVNKGGHWFLAGIISFGQDCASSTPSVNTRVAPYLNWITKTIGPKSICVKTLT